MADLPWIVLLIAFSLGIDLWLVAVRAVYLEVSPARLLSLVDSGSPRGDMLQALLQQTTRLRASLNLGLVFTRFILAGAGLALLDLTGLPRAWWPVALLVAGFVLFWFEWLVARGGQRNPELWLTRLGGSGRTWIALTGWLVWLPLRTTGEEKATESTSTVTEEEIKSFVDAAVQEEGVLQDGERRMLSSVLELGETLAREIMVPRIDMLALDARTPLDTAIDQLIRSGYSRVPVYEDSVDNTLGLLYTKDLLRIRQEGGELASLTSLIRPAYFVPEAKKVDELLAEMQRRRIHMALVVDEYGGIAGLVTLEDIVEEIVGEIQDEYDQAEELPYQDMGNGEILFLGRVDLDDFNEVMGSNLAKDDADTLGGYIYSHLGRVPQTGDEVRAGTLLLAVEQVLARRIRKVRARWLTLDMSSEEEAKHVDR
jgi:CBS domain containing-hemolysin-like protein